MFNIRTKFNRSISRAAVIALLSTLMVPVVTVVVLPMAPSTATSCLSNFTDVGNDWRAVRTTDGAVVIDPDDITDNATDLVGSTETPTFQYFSEGTGCNFYFRIQIVDSPLDSGGDFGNNARYTLAISDGNSILAWVGVVGDNADGTVYVANASGTITSSNSVTNSGGSNSDIAWAQPIAGSNRYWVNFKVPLADLPAGAVGSVAVMGGTANSQSTNVWNRDCVTTLVGNDCVVTSSDFSTIVTSNLSVASNAAPDIYLKKSGGETGTAVTQTVLKNSRVETVTVTNIGGAADSFTISANLPAGMTFETATGRIYGAPSETRTATIYTITANSANGSGTATYTLTVNDVAPAFTISTGGTPCASPCTESTIRNQALDTVTVNVGAGSGQIDTYSVSPALPNGLALNPLTGQISGTPTDTQTQTTYTLTAHGPGGTSAVTYRLTVTASAVPADVTFTGAGETRTVSSRIGTSLPSYTIANSGGHVDSYTISPSLSSPLQFDTTTGVISGTPTTLETATVYTITAHSVGGNDTLTYTLTVLPQQFSITVTQPTGGTISLNPSGGTYDSGTVVNIAVSLSGGYTDGTWSGDCSGSTGTSCSLTVNAAKSVGATLTAPAASGGGSSSPAATSYNLTVIATGQGIVTPATGAQPAGAVVMLAAAPSAGWKFSTWSGACAGSTETCTLTMSSDKSVAAVFALDATSDALAAKFPVSVTVTGLGIVQVSPGQPAGGYTKDSLVKLTAAPRTGWSLTAWGGACSGASEFCILTVDGAKTVTATFKATSVPEVVSAAWVQPQNNGTSVISWEGSSGAVQYIAEVNGRSLCTTTQTSCSVGRLVGPNDIVVVIATNAAGKADMSPLATYVAPTRALQLFSVYFNSGSSTLTARARTALTAAISRIKSFGYTELTLHGHTDNRETGANALSLARARAVAAFVGRSIDVNVLTVGRGATTPLTTNSTIQGRSFNRRVVGWVK